MRDLQLLKQKLSKVARITIACLPEDMPIPGNVLASGDDKQDRDAEDWVRSELRRGNDWAWCCVRITAEWQGIKGIDTLGCSSYTSEAQFKECAYYKDMVGIALDELTLKVYDLGKAKEALT